MDAEIAVDLCRNATWIALLIASPVLIAGTTVGLLIGLFQALTQIQEQTIAIVLKIIVMILVLAFLMPWMTIKMLDYSSELFQEINQRML
ncbi:MAG: flagellar biosynthesis protein FliQ [Planctomycetaceae bacterium]|jgi:flagellar biosynthetic protein FliQ|nr:flagellar biosynthesis protein FliQ [Planctomycetaceae bacterium]